jgi:beta-glucanase (GH16 family)
LQLGESLTLSAKVSNASQVEWLSIDENIAQVSSNGVVTAVGVGSVEIVALASGETAICQITVTYPQTDEQITLPCTGMQLAVGDKFTLNAYSSNGSPISWRTSDSSVAIVDEGVITAISSGNATITAYVGSAQASCAVSVISTGASSTLTAEKYTAVVKEGDKVTLSATSSDGSPITWLSSDESVATIKNGVVSGVSVGTVTIYAWTAKASMECYVVVTSIDDTRKEGYTLVWNDEFNGDSLDTTKWSYMNGTRDVYGSSQGPMFWGNNELQYYTQDAVQVTGGNLIITATRQDMPDGRTYSSARLCTRDNAYWTYGYFEARIKLPAISGMWPAFWMLPQPSTKANTSNQYGGWASNGEIDIMEAKGRLSDYVDTTVHYGNQGSSTYKTTSVKLNKSIDEWHIYALKWTQDSLTWYVDGDVVFKVSSDDWWSQMAPDSSTAPFDTNFYILLNLAVGGNYDGGRTPDESFTSAAMTVDYVRVYKED